MAFGFIANEATVSGISNFYDVTKPIKLVGPSSVDAYSRVIPQAGYLSQLDLQMTLVSGSPKCVKSILTWDAAGNDPCFGELPSWTMFSGVTTATTQNATIPIRTFLRAPSTQTALGEIYLWIKVDKVSSITLDVARLHWATRHWG
jgi:hypothetical protein